MADLTWTPAGPRSTRFDDIYFSAEDGLAESQAVFLQGCGLPERWRGRRRFTVGELGFGTGLNVLALLDLWRRERPPSATLHVFSVEAFPLAREEAERALACWPELGPVARRLLDAWPHGGGVHRINWPELGATLDVAHAEALQALEQWEGSADGWFLDGFAPARNPEMWSEAVLSQVARRSAPGAVAATFTVAGSVRRGLEGAGFSVAKRPGFGRKRERLEARLPGQAVDAPIPRVAIIGAGVAGASLARAFAALGVPTTIVAPVDGPPNPAALVSPRFDAAAAPAARLTLQAFRRALNLYTDVPGAVIGRGLVQLESRPRDAARFDAVARGSLFARGEVRRLSPAEATSRIGEPVAIGALHVPAAMTVDPEALLSAWTSGTERIVAKAASMIRAADGWRLHDEGGAQLVESDVVVLAAGWPLSRLRPDLRLSPVRGQASWFPCDQPLEQAIGWGGYAIPTRDGVLFGATHDRDRTDGDPAAEDDLRNLKTLAAVLPGLAASASGLLSSRAGVRAVTPDRLPLAGSLGDGLHVLGGLGSRGFTLAPLLAEQVAAHALGVAGPLPLDLAGLVEPHRFG